MDYNEIYWKLLAAFASLVALYFLVGKDESSEGKPENQEGPKAG